MARRRLAGALAQGRDRVQQRARGSGAAVLRPGNHGDGREEGTADRRRRTERRSRRTTAGADARDRRGDDQVPAGCARRADRRAGVADRSRERRRRLGGTAQAPSTVAAVAGYPHITVPAGFVHGLPVGISFFGRAWSEADADQARVRVRAGDEARRPPTFATCGRAVRLEPAVSPPLAGHESSSLPLLSVSGSAAMSHDAPRLSDYSALCQTARPTKNGPSRSR